MVDRQERLPVGIADDHDPREARVFGRLEAANAGGFAEKQPAPDPACEKGSGLHVQMPGVERREHGRAPREQLPEPRESPRRHVDDVWSKALDLLEERPGDAPSDEIGVERSAPRRGPEEPGHIADWARIRSRQEAHESIVSTILLVGRAKADDTNVVRAA
jgi:hypothetical protein